MAILQEAAAHIGITPMLVADSGTENVNRDVDVLVDAGVITRVLALVEVTYSNSIIEAYWRSLKHQWLFLCELGNAIADQSDSAEDARKQSSTSPLSSS